MALLSETAELPRLAPVDSPTARHLLATGDADLLGRMPWASNATFLIRLADADAETLAIYKPRRGERPLWDFATGSLCNREVASFAVSDALGWEIVPETVLRDGPLGPGMVQHFVDHDPDDHYFTLQAEHEDTFRRFAAFDIVVNNTDRKGGHCLLATDGHVWGIDHGVTFHADWKLRTVIWEFAGEALSSADLADLERMDALLDGGDLEGTLCSLLAPDEVDATRERLRRLLKTKRYPIADDDYRNYPWPLV